MLSRERASLALPLPEAKSDLRLRLYLKLMLLDGLAILFAFLLIEAIFSVRWLSWQEVNLAAMVLPIYLGIAINGNAYSLHALKHPLCAAVQAVINLLLTMLAIQCVLYFAHVSDTISRLSFASAIALGSVLLAILRKPFAVYALRRARGQLTDDLIISDGIPVDRSTGAHWVDAATHGLYPDLNDPQMLNRLGRWLRVFDRVVIACPPDRRHAWAIILQGAAIQGEIMLNDDGESGAIGMGRCLGRDTHIVSKGPLSMSSRLQKRVFDLALTIPAIILLSPLLIIVAIMIKLDSRGPVLFLQERVGLGNRLFKIAKFRSMKVEQADSSGTVSASRIDDRITRVGRIIRKTSIDELPQLFNVILGDMSIVGPRPHALGSKADSKLFWEVSHHYWRRHALKPGMTGLAQVRGYRGATEKVEDLENRLAADLEYLKDWTLAGELLIILQTFRVLVHRNAF